MNEKHFNFLYWVNMQHLLVIYVSAAAVHLCLGC